MRNHTLMQTIARANRVFEQKVNGLIVDYIGVFRDLQEALAIYGSASGGGVIEGDTPVKDKSALVEKLRVAISEAVEFCTQRGIDFHKLQTTKEAFTRTKIWDDAVEAILINDDSKHSYFSITANVSQLYKAILPDTAANEFSKIQVLLEKLAQKIRLEVPENNISEMMESVAEILDDSITAGEFVIYSKPQIIDLSRLDFDALQAEFATGYQNTKAEKLKVTIKSKLQQMVQQNKTRINSLEKFQKMIDEYNAASQNVEWFFNQLISFARDLKTEDKRPILENLTEEELAIFDLLTKPKIELNQK
ncbi:type I restriction enzyme endonuclease domain-containing protein [Calothrix sp. CCY 0018]|uniref:type I restriction enzyme endonuclease domain-containing protein n=1 Tax=Calothrix sp. CCY 0018 TaxID=3103864 RepID=UPI0039C64552